MSDSFFSRLGSALNPPAKIIAKARRIAAHPITITKQAILIHGDNFAGMSRLLPNYTGKIDLVYIDPPYNTNSDFYYDKKRTAHVSHGSQSALAYSDKGALIPYLAALFERLALIRELLSPAGTIYLHLDSKTGPYAKILLDEIFGDDCFCNAICPVKSNPKNFARSAYGNFKDMIYVYAKTPGKNIFNNLKEQLTDGEIAKAFPKIDAFGRRYATVPCHAPGETKNGVTGTEWRGLKPPAGRHWRCAPDELEKLDQRGLIEWSGNGVPRIIKFAEESAGRKIQDVWLNYKDPQYPVYPTEKNMAMLEMIARQSSNQGSLALDCYCGSGAFLAAALRHGRKVIGIDQSDIAIRGAAERQELRGAEIIAMERPAPATTSH